LNYPIRTVHQLRPILQGFRKAAGITQAMMASQLGITQQAYAQLEANPAAASVERLLKVLRLLHVDLTLTQETQEAISQQTAGAGQNAPAPAAATAARVKQESAPRKADRERRTTGTRRAAALAPAGRGKPDQAPVKKTTTARNAAGKTGAGRKRASRPAAKPAKKREDW
jgi:HTH-type transcriptional regulator / antitoxin HipB